jgi:hypothetical protein
MLAKKRTKRPRLGKPPLVDSCQAFRSDGEIVEKRWPEFYTGSES